MGVRLLRGIGGKVLTCGCLVGVYETYDGRIVKTIDARGPSCESPLHRVHAEVVDPTDQPTRGSTESGASHR